MHLAHLSKSAPEALSRLGRGMAITDNSTKKKGIRVTNCMTYAEANSVYAHDKDAITEVVPDVTSSGRKMNVSCLTYPTVIKALVKKNKLGR